MLEFGVKSSEQIRRGKVKGFSAGPTYTGKDCLYSKRPNKINIFLPCHKENVIKSLTELLALSAAS